MGLREETFWFWGNCNLSCSLCGDQRRGHNPSQPLVLAPAPPPAPRQGCSSA
jgi:hypothetical protein